jgi:oxygen-independent coproporphyrinogen-3 oxidase
VASLKGKERFLPALQKEIALTREYLAGEPVNTIYFGGGTPSVYNPRELQEIIEMVASPPVLFHAGMTSPPDLSSNGTTTPPGPFKGTASPIDSFPKGEGRIFPAIEQEITLELNPDDVTEAYVAELKQTSFKRFSLGVQSFFDDDLEYLNRSHSAAQAFNSVRLLQEAGFENLSIDLIYGIPASTTDRWLKNLETAFSLGVPHISAYALTIESRTPLAWMIANPAGMQFTTLTTGMAFPTSD